MFIQRVQSDYDFDSGERVLCYSLEEGRQLLKCILSLDDSFLFDEERDLYDRIRTDLMRGIELLESIPGPDANEIVRMYYEKS